MCAIPHFSSAGFLVCVETFLLASAATSLDSVDSSTASVGASDDFSETTSFTFSSLTASVSDNVYHSLKGFKKHIHTSEACITVSLVSTWSLFYCLAQIENGKPMDRN